MEYGKYLANTCTSCHGSNFNGQLLSWAESLAPNLTPGGELKGWSEADFTATLRTGVTPGGHQLKDAMPWEYFGQMTDDEMKAVWMYLQSLPALPQGE